MSFTILSLGRWVYLNNVGRTKRFIRRLEFDSGVTLSSAEKQRIQFYTVQSSLTNQWFTTLRGHQPGIHEQAQALVLGAFTPLADDWMDENKLTFSGLAEKAESGDTQYAAVALLYGKLQEECKQNKEFQYWFDRAHRAQDQSIKQLAQAPLTEEELLNITFEKGGAYTVLYRFILKNPPTEGEIEAIYTLGGILQLVNDLFDVHKDWHNGVQTLVTRCTSIFDLVRLFDQRVNEFYLRYRSLNYPHRNIEQSLLEISLIISRGYVAIRQLKELEAETGKFHPAFFSRKQLIVDMEKPQNIVRGFLETYQLMRITIAGMH
jgi:hypothetical protein